jgi:hypothetical protein
MCQHLKIAISRKERKTASQEEKHLFLSNCLNRQNKCKLLRKTKYLLAADRQTANTRWNVLIDL